MCSCLSANCSFFGYPIVLRIHFVHPKVGILYDQGDMPGEQSLLWSGHGRHGVRILSLRECGVS